jgi:hypothetical protein
VLALTTRVAPSAPPQQKNSRYGPAMPVDIARQTTNHLLKSPRAGHRNCQNIVKLLNPWHDHSLKSSWGALSDGMIQPFSRGEMHLLNFSKTNRSLKSYLIPQNLDRFDFPKR